MTKLDDEAVLLDLETGAYFGLNHVGRDAIEAFNDGHEFTATISKLADDYQVPREQVERDINLLITDMLDKRLLVCD